MARRDKATRAGAVSGALSGISCGIISWLVYAKVGFSLLACTVLHCRPEVELKAQLSVVQVACSGVHSYHLPETLLTRVANSVGCGNRWYFTWLC